MVKHVPTMRDTWVQSLGLEDLLEKKMAVGSYISIITLKVNGLNAQIKRYRLLGI